MAWMRQNESERGASANPPRDTVQDTSRTDSSSSRRSRDTSTRTSGNINIGQSIQINGTLTGKEDLTIDGVVDGTIELKDHVLTIGANGRIKADLNARQIVIVGQVHGNITATDKVDIAPSGSVEGDIRSPRIAISDGAEFRGRIEMGKHIAGASSKPKSEKSSGASTPIQQVPRSAASS